MFDESFTFRRRAVRSGRAGVRARRDPATGERGGRVGDDAQGRSLLHGRTAYDSIYLCNLQINDLQAYRTAKRTVMTLEDYSTSGDILTAGIADWGSASGAYASGSGNFNNVGNPDYDNGTNAYNMGQWAMAMNYYTQAYNAYNAAWWSFDSARETAAAAYDRLMTEKVRLTVLYGN
jgi:hypothetical protein